MRHRCRFAVLSVLLCLVGALAVPAQEERTARVTFLTAASVYLDAGTDEGLNVGDTVEVLREGQVVATLRIRFVSAHKAVGERIASAAILEVGDLVRYTSRPARYVPPNSPEAPKPRVVRSAGSRGPLAAAGLRGRIGASFIALRARDGRGDYRQPGLELRLDGRHVFGLPVDLGIDLRTRRSYRTLTSGRDDVESRTRVYSAFAAWQREGSPLRVTAGRQYSPSLAAISLFDGVLAEYRRERWGAGVFTGTEPDPVDLGWSSDVREHGAFVEWNGAPEAERRWTVTTGAVGSYASGTVNREFLFVQGLYAGPRLSAYATQEIDVNRDWRREAEGKGVSWTSAFASARWRAFDWLDLDAGFDNRRNVRLYRDAITPETEFDDRFRRGWWLGATGRWGEHLFYGMTWRRADAGDAERATSWTVTAGVRRLTRFDLDVRGRSTRYTNELVEGWLHSLSVRGALSARMQLELHGGVRDEDVRSPAVVDGTLRWLGFDWDVVLGRHWFFIVSAERNSGGTDANDQLYTAIRYRF